MRRLITLKPHPEYTSRLYSIPSTRQRFLHHHPDMQSHTVFQLFHRLGLILTTSPELQDNIRLQATYTERPFDDQRIRKGQLGR
jgi:hypothetical protein